mmetsp:Transcript_28673/g.81014  ORF Transcript_28673/g.81014 Transcript_28673/m.81014 type:complete len:390 (-) Transcript_28673:363-1532(-)
MRLILFGLLCNAGVSVHIHPNDRKLIAASSTLRRTGNIYDDANPRYLDWKLLSTLAPPGLKNRKEYTGMMFAGGVKVNGTYSWAARVCTNRCIQPTTSVMAVATSGATLSHPIDWKRAAVFDAHDDTNGTARGYEDPRIDVVDGKRFALVTMNWAGADAAGCKPIPWGKVRHQMFIPIDAAAGKGPCYIDVKMKGVKPCLRQKNWVPIVPKGSKSVFILYSLMPMQVFEFDRSQCAARPTAGMGPKLQNPNMHFVSNGARYVHGFDVPNGMVYWSIGHTTHFYKKNSWGKQVLTAVLVGNATSKFTFELIGLSYAFDFDGLLDDPKSFALSHSIYDFSAEDDTAQIGLHINDVVNDVLEVHGVLTWLRTVYDEHQSFNFTPWWKRSDRP